MSQKKQIIVIGTLLLFCAAAIPLAKKMDSPKKLNEPDLSDNGKVSKNQGSVEIAKSAPDANSEKSLSVIVTEPQALEKVVPSDTIEKDKVVADPEIGAAVDVSTGVKVDAPNVPLELLSNISKTREESSSADEFDVLNEENSKEADEAVKTETTSCPVDVCPDSYENLPVMFHGYNFASSLRVRSGPSTSYQKLSSLRYNQHVDVLYADSNEDGYPRYWYFVQKESDDSFGWVSSNSISRFDEGQQYSNALPTYLNTPRYRTRKVFPMLSNLIFKGGYLVNGQKGSVIEAEIPLDATVKIGSILDCKAEVLAFGRTIKSEQGYIQVRSLGLIDRGNIQFGVVDPGNNSQNLSARLECSIEVTEEY